MGDHDFSCYVILMSSVNVCIKHANIYASCTTALYNFANWYLILFMVITRCGWKSSIDPPIGQKRNHESFPYPVPLLHSKYLFSGEDRTVCDTLLTLQMS